MTLQEIVGHFEVSRKNGASSYQCKCPVHLDNKASLTISERNGKILLHCHAGCDTREILEAVGLTFKDLGEHQAEGWRERLEQRMGKRIEAVYDYKDEKGAYLYSKLRLEGNVCLSHNTLRGAAGGAVLLAELLCAEGYIQRR